MSIHVNDVMTDNMDIKSKTNLCVLVQSFASESR